MTAPPQNIIILGGGIAGVTTAYFLSVSPHRDPSTRITLVEGSRIAAGASGYSGGFLAKDWHGSATASLAAMSFDLHAKLAKEFGGEKWGYRTVDTLSITTDATRKSKKAAPIHWLPEGLVHASRALGDHTTTAQVHPGLFTKFFAEQFLSKPNTSLVIGTATSMKLSPSTQRPESVSVDGNEVAGDVVVIAAGPWSGKLAVELLGKDLGGKLGIEGHRAHSVVLKTKDTLTPHCLFTNMTLKDGSMGEPELYTRPDGTTYICGAGDAEPLPERADQVKPDPEAIAKLLAETRALSPVFSAQSADTLAEQACFLPIPTRGRPLVGKVRGVEGVYIGGGLSCWGITQGPGTGLVLSELILEGKVKSADISKLSP
ncbi:hypothetical protein P7C73_g6332, partial [Tremellales sp. Uapishka_1]